MLPVPSVLRRITVEEAELTRVLGDPYHRYQRRTRRLIPGLWLTGDPREISTCAVHEEQQSRPSLGGVSLVL
jgi:hypothetical protein